MVGEEWATEAAAGRLAGRLAGGKPFATLDRLPACRVRAYEMVHVPTLAELKEFVRQVLCARADLDLMTPLLETVLWRKARPCGIEYTLMAPRSVRLSAIWDASCGRLLFYDHDLERFQVTAVQGPEITAIDGYQTRPTRWGSLWRGK